MSENDESALLQGGNLGVGDILRRERLRQKLTLDDIAVVVRISKGYLRDIEQNQFHNLPGLPYVLGFVRTYAEFLKLNSEGLVEQVKIEMGYETTIAAERLHSVQEEGFEVKQDRSFLTIIISIVILALIIVGVVYYLNTPDTSTVDTQPLAPASSAHKGATSGDATATSHKESSQKANASSAKVYGTKGKANFVVTATAPVWIQVKDRMGRVVFSRMLALGDQYRVPVGVYLLTTGNAGAVSVSFRGHRSTVLGKEGETRHNILLTYKGVFGAPHVAKPQAANTTNNNNSNDQNSAQASQ